MFARPYAPSDRTQPIVSPRKTGKHYQLFRSLGDSVTVPTTPVLAHTYSATARPHSAAPVAHAAAIAAQQRPGSASVGYPFSPSPFHSPFSPAATGSFHSPIAGSQTARANLFSANANLSSASNTPSPHPPPPPALTRPSTSIARELQKGNSDYQAAFLYAVDVRHKTEADRLTLFNRLAHLKAQEEKSERAVALTEQHIARVALAKRRHQEESEAKLRYETAREEERARVTNAMRLAHQQRKEAFLAYKRELVVLRKEQALAQRGEHQELLSHRDAMTREELEKYKIVREDIRERHRLIHERKQSAKQYELYKSQQSKAWKILLEEQRRMAAEEDMRLMIQEEQELLRRAEETRKKHQEAVERLATLVLKEEKLPTARARYTSMSIIQGRQSQRKIKQQQAASTSANISKQGTPGQDTRIFSLSLPTTQQQERTAATSSSTVSIPQSMSHTTNHVADRLQHLREQEEEKEQTTTSSPTPVTPIDTAPSSSPISPKPIATSVRQLSLNTDDENNSHEMTDEPEENVDEDDAASIQSVDESDEKAEADTAADDSRPSHDANLDLSSIISSAGTAGTIGVSSNVTAVGPSSSSPITSDTVDNATNRHRQARTCRTSPPI